MTSLYLNPGYPSDYKGHVGNIGSSSPQAPNTLVQQQMVNKLIVIKMHNYLDSLDSSFPLNNKNQDQLHIDSTVKQTEGVEAPKTQDSSESDLPASPKGPPAQKTIPNPRWFTFSDGDITRSTGKRYVRQISND